jgi:hypothetical protein
LGFWVSGDVVGLYKNDGGPKARYSRKPRDFPLHLVATSLSGDDNLGHNCAMTDGMREVKLRRFHAAKGMAIGQRCPEKLRKALNFKPDLDFRKD